MEFRGDNSPSKDAWIHARLGIGKMQSYAAQTRESPNWWAFLSTRETVNWSFTGSFDQIHCRGNQHDLKKQMNGVYDQAVQVHSWEK